MKATNWLESGGQTLVWKKIDRNSWSFFHQEAEGEELHRVGPIYGTQRELLKDMADYGRRFWGFNFDLEPMGKHNRQQ